MFKLFTFGVFVGLIGTGLLLYYVPVVDVAREQSVIAVRANGGNSEVFRVELPADRIMVGSSGTAYPQGLDWPVTVSCARNSSRFAMKRVA